MYVASLAQTKAKRARQYVAQARKGHAEILTKQEFMGELLLVRLRSSSSRAVPLNLNVKYRCEISLTSG